MSNRARVFAAVALVGAVVGLPAEAQAPTPVSERGRGLVRDGLVEGTGACRGSLQNDRGRCSHPDPAPEGINVQEPRPMAELVAATTAASGGVIVCEGDGVSGNRVQAVYAVAADRVDRYDQLLPSIGQWAANADAVFSNSAARAGGVRHIRWVTNADCSLSVLRVALSSSADDSFSNTITELWDRGFTRSDRKYMLWMDANVYCGIGEISGDDRPGPENINNFGPSFGRTDSGCWGLTASVEAHELMHNLGGVQLSAPHSSNGWHCTDESDRMCYSENGMAMTYPCATGDEMLFDCRGDDYFSTAPPAGSYVESHWNAADSAFLTATGGDAPVVTTTTTTATTVASRPCRPRKRC